MQDCVCKHEVPSVSTDPYKASLQSKLCGSAYLAANQPPHTGPIDLEKRLMPPRRATARPLWRTGTDVRTTAPLDTENTASEHPVRTRARKSNNGDRHMKARMLDMHTPHNPRVIVMSLSVQAFAGSSVRKRE